ncbi:armadillo-like helical domain-containing protein 4 isoform X2 [Hyperolius riggenbachi]|uniref:armadillo-like helical domain-containing protein 4 isoform X2 n=1 Tax=Hyperolius riggenbachi TaxID=752182 RepID=UPI0035A2E5B4
MKRSLVFHICGLLCSILLVSPRATCLSLQRLEKRDVNNEEVGGTHTSKTRPGDSLLPTPSGIPKDVNVPVTLRNVVPAIPEQSQNQSGLLNNGTLNPNPEVNVLSPTNAAGPTAQIKTPNVNSVQTTSGLLTDYTTVMQNQPPDENGAKKSLDNQENLSQVNTMEMLTTNPRTSILETENIQSTMPVELIGQPSTSTHVLTPEIPSSSGTSTLINQTNGRADFTVSLINEDWDDTKIITPRSNTVRTGDQVTPVPDQVMEDERDETVLFTISPGVTVPSDDKSVFSATKNTQDKELSSNFDESTVTHMVSPSPEIDFVPHDDLSSPLPSITLDDTQELKLTPPHKDVIQPDSDISDNSNVTVTPAIAVDATSQETTRQPEAEKAEEAVMDSGKLKETAASDKSITSPTNTSQVLPDEIPETEDLRPLSKEDDHMVGSVSPAVPEVTVAPDHGMVVTVTSAPQVNVMAPPTRRITTTPAYGVTKLESEEGDEEDEEEEDEDDDEVEDDEEEDEDDEKDNDSVDDSAEKDSDLPLYTLPGLSSQEPLEDDSNIALIDGAAYQVPDTMEWEQQNQGLVRSWMEKLKDKAGYMSGMLVPVGVGIAGALLILGALYSVKIMNRRRRNGFKRHKRKRQPHAQLSLPASKREFNSMQDRVMLLADSSEDEF